MNRWGALVILLAFAGALAFRLPKLDRRPLHNDEAVNAVMVTELWQEGRYRYDPNEYHGPTLHYATLPFFLLAGARTADDLNDGTLRLAPVAFGAGLILLLFLFFDGIGWRGLAWAALFLAISPAMVFYSRYFIHEMLLVFFNALAIGAGWRYTQSRSPVWAGVFGAAIGLMFATKETFVISLAAMGVASLVLAWCYMRGAVRANVAGSGETGPQHLGLVARWRESVLAVVRLEDVAIAFAGFIVVWLVFFSSFFTNFAGLADSVRTYLPWLDRAAGNSPHIHPWYFYLQRLAWFHPLKGPVWSEAFILALAAVGGIKCVAGKRSPLVFFLTIYTVVLTGAYSIISYKTPWCLLNFYYGMILLAGAGAGWLVDSVRSRVLKIGIVIVLLTASAQLGIQAWRASYVYATDRRNPYVYAQTVPDLLHVVQRAEGLARVSPAGFETVIKVIAPESDYWPLPWYLRRFKNIGWYESLPPDPFAPVIIVSSKLNARLDDTSDRKWIMAGITELRPGQFFEFYVELELWKKYVETLPPEPN